MSPDKIKEELTFLIRTQLKYEGNLDEGELADQLDSIQRLTLVIAIEDHFKICFDPDDEQQIHGLNDLIEQIAKKVEQP
jgi:acyl carrier protein